MNQEWKGPLRLGAVLFGLYLAVHYWEKLSSGRSGCQRQLSSGAGGGHRICRQYPYEHV